MNGSRSLDKPLSGGDAANRFRSMLPFRNVSEDPRFQRFLSAVDRARRAAKQNGDQQVPVERSEVNVANQLLLLAVLPFRLVPFCGLLLGGGLMGLGTAVRMIFRGVERLGQLGRLRRLRGRARNAGDGFRETGFAGGVVPSATAAANGLIASANPSMPARITFFTMSSPHRKPDVPTRAARRVHFSTLARRLPS